MTTMTPDDFRQATNVSRETLTRLECYAALLVKWSGAINLVSHASLPDLWRRHMLDSAQLMTWLPPPPAGRARILLDLGSGAGFPGLVLAILGAGEVHLVESDTKKAAFLTAAARETGTKIALHTCRIESLPEFTVDALTARALAPLPQLLTLVEPFFKQNKITGQNEQANKRTNIITGPGPDSWLDQGPLALFPKGRGIEQELTDSAKTWMIRAEILPSLSGSEGRVLRLSGLARKDDRRD